MSRRSKRKIVIGETEWSYIIGGSMVVARNKVSPETRKIYLTELTGWTWDDIERRTYKRYFHITPSQIANWLSGGKLPETTRQ